MKLEDIHSVYFIGIGGIGMSALARWFRQRGSRVAGYDRVETELCKRLISEGIEIHFDDKLELVPKWAMDKENCLIVFTPAVPASHSELKYFRENGFDLKKRSEVLGIISKDHFTIAVGGTHGKTTTSSIIAHLLYGSDTGCSAFVGGIMTNYDTNLLVGDIDAPVVAEADEFDRSFLRLHPKYTVVTSLDPDHLDIYGDPDQMLNSYIDFIELSGEEGKVLVEEAVAKKLGKRLTGNYRTYGLTGSEIKAENLKVDDGMFVFDYVGMERINELRFQLPGFHNVTNALAAITVALDRGMDKGSIKERIESYRGVKRRFEYIIKSDSIIYIDDYAHHPSEINALLDSVKELYPEKRITTIFQPHLYSRTRDFQDGFGQSLSKSDELMLLDIYPAREEPIPGITSGIVFEKVEGPTKSLHQLNEFPEVLEGRNPEVLLTVGAGNIDTLVPRIKAFYSKEVSHEA